jgi:hypothetical protein
MARKHISQREALRNRRDLKKLRELIARLSGTYPSAEKEFMEIEIDARFRQEAIGMSWGARGDIVFTARFDGLSLFIGARRIPT